MFKHRSDRNPGSNPDFLEMFGRTFVDRRFRSFTANGGKWTLERTHDIGNRDLRRAAIKPVSTLDSAAARHDAVVSEIAENRLKKLHRNMLRGRDGVTFDECTRIIFGNRRKFEQRTHRVINFGRHMHGHSQAEGAVNV